MYNVELQNKVREYISTNNLTQAAASQMIGTSKAFISLFLNNKPYNKGRATEQEAKIAEFFKLESEKQAVEEKALPFRKTIDYVDTSISENVYRLIRYCQIEKGMVIAYGDAGIGKTKGAEKFAAENPTSTIYIEATPASGTLKSILKLLARALKIPEVRSTFDLVGDIRQKLRTTNKIIIIDEAQHLKLAALDEIRTLSSPNAITGDIGTGIALIGNIEVYDRMLGRGEARFGQLFNRVLMHEHYITDKVQPEDIHKLFPQYTSKDKREVEYLLGISRSKWGIRGATNVYKNAVNNGNVSYDGLFSVTCKMGIAVI